jgi:hypothetical protein
MQCCGQIAVGWIAKARVLNVGGEASAEMAAWNTKM